MKSLAALLLVLVSVTAATGQKSSSTVGATDDAQSKMARKLAAISPDLRRRSSVPPRLITFFPRLEKSDDLYVNLRSAEPGGYEVIVAFTPDCEGQNACGYGILRGSEALLDTIAPEGNWVPVKLRGGIRARYYDSQCAAYCSYSVVAWTEGRWSYTVELEAEKKGLVVRAADSALGEVR